MSDQQPLTDTERRQIITRLKLKFSNHPELDFDGALGHAELKFWEEETVPDNPQAWLFQKAAWRCVDLIRRHNVVKSSEHEYGSALGPVSLSPADRSETLERRELQAEAFRRAVRRFVEECERANRNERKEVFERRFCGESAEEIATTIGKCKRQANRYFEEAYVRLLELIEIIDPDYSLFSSLVHGPTRMTARRGVESAADTLLRVLQTTDALCPSEARFTAYVRQGRPVAIRDLHFHVEVKECPHCAARLERWK